MFRLAVHVLIFSVAIAGSGAVVVCAQDYPAKTVRLVTSGAGGGGDVLSRLILAGLSTSLAQQVIVDNRSAGVSLVESVAKAAPDGYTLLVYGTPLWVSSLLMHTPYDPIKDFSPITLAISSPNIVAIHPSLPVRSVREFIDLAKAKPGMLNYGASGIGGTNHLAGELFKSMAGINIVNVQYNGAAPALTALLSGEVQLLFSSSGAVAPHLKSGRLRALAVTSAQPTALAPGLPTVAASGVPGYEAVAIIGFFAPAKTPDSIVKRLNQEIVRVLHRTEIKEKFFRIGIDTVGSSPEDLAAAVKSEMARLGKVIRDAGIKTE